MFEIVITAAFLQGTVVFTHKDKFQDKLSCEVAIPVKVLELAPLFNKSVKLGKVAISCNPVARGT